MRIMHTHTHPPFVHDQFSIKKKSFAFVLFYYKALFSFFLLFVVVSNSKSCFCFVRHIFFFRLSLLIKFNLFVYACIMHVLIYAYIEGGGDLMFLLIVYILNICVVIFILHTHSHTHTYRNQSKTTLVSLLFIVYASSVLLYFHREINIYRSGVGCADA